MSKRKKLYITFRNKLYLVYIYIYIYKLSHTHISPSALTSLSPRDLKAYPSAEKTFSLQISISFGVNL